MTAFKVGYLGFFLPHIRMQSRKVNQPLEYFTELRCMKMVSLSLSPLLLFVFPFPLSSFSLVILSHTHLSMKMFPKVVKL